MIVESYIKSGSSSPVIIKHKGKRHFVKLRAGMSGKYALLNEWLGCMLGQQIGIAVQQPFWIEIGDDLNMENAPIEVKDLLQKSKGWNLGFAFNENFQALSTDDLSKVDVKSRNRIFLFDLVMLNIDRTIENINLVSCNDRIISIDYESSMLVQEIIGEDGLRGNQRILQCFRNNPLFGAIEKTAVLEFIESTKQFNFPVILDKLPSSLLTKKERSRIIAGAEKLTSENWHLWNTFERLNDMRADTQEMVRQRANANQAAFKKRLEGLN